MSKTANENSVRVKFRTWYSSYNSCYGDLDSERRITLPESCVDKRITENSDYYKNLEKHFGIEEYKELLKNRKLSKKDIIIVGEGFIHPQGTPKLVPTVYLTHSYYPVNEKFLVKEGWRGVSDWKRYTEKSEKLLNGVNWWVEKPKV
ncbi:MAG: hypothetical protein AABX88_00290 [Nanoarchaeota archaeon]